MSEPDRRVTLTGHIVVAAEDYRDICEALPEHIQLTRAEPGCLEFSVTVDPAQPGRFNVHEVFVDRAAFDAHQMRVKQSHWGRISAQVARHYQLIDANNLHASALYE